MRSVNQVLGISRLWLSMGLAMSLSLGLGGCATGGYSTSGGSVREIEMAPDDGHPSDRPILPAGDFELLMKHEPGLNAYRPLRLRILVAQPGRLQFHLYENDEKGGRPGKLIYTLSGAYSAPVTSNGKDGKWVTENLPDLPVMSGTIWVGVAVPDTSSEARVWATANDSGRVFQRDMEPGTALMSSTVRYTPMVRLVLQPQ